VTRLGLRYGIHVVTVLLDTLGVDAFRRLATGAGL